MADLNHIPGLKAKLGAVRARLGRLAFVRAFWPLLVFAGLYLALALLGVFRAMPATLAAGGILSSLIIAILLALRGARTWHQPQAGEALDLLDRQSPLRPLSGLMDRPATVGGAAQALWVENARRLRAALDDLSMPSFSGAWRQLDPAFLRFALPALLAGLFLLAGPERGARLQAAFSPNLGALAGADALRVEAWITPPAHTGRPPIFLEAGMDPIRVPAGSEVTLRAFHRAAPDLLLDTGPKRTRRWSSCSRTVTPRKPEPSPTTTPLSAVPCMTARPKAMPAASSTVREISTLGSVFTIAPA